MEMTVCWLSWMSLGCCLDVALYQCGTDHMEAVVSTFLGNKRCATDLIQLEFTAPCVKLFISKGLGVGIVAGGAILKVPQIFKIMAAKNGKGISFISYLLETISYTISVCYNWRHSMPLSTYGEGNRRP